MDRLCDYAHMPKTYRCGHKGDYMQQKSPLVTLRMTVDHKLGSGDLKHRKKWRNKRTFRITIELALCRTKLESSCCCVSDTLWHGLTCMMHYNTMSAIIRLRSSSITCMQDWKSSCDCNISKRHLVVTIR